MNFLQTENTKSTDPVLLFTGKCAVWDAECHIRETGKDLEAVGQDIAGAEDPTPDPGAEVQGEGPDETTAPGDTGEPAE